MNPDYNDITFLNGKEVSAFYLKGIGKMLSLLTDFRTASPRNYHLDVGIANK